MKIHTLLLLFLLCLLIFPKGLLAQSEWQLFHDKFPDTLLTDSFVFDFDVSYEKRERYYKDSSYLIPYYLRLQILPDSLVRQRIPVCKWNRNDTIFYFTVEDVGSWNCGYLFIRVKNKFEFLSITSVYQSLPGDGGQFYEYSVLDNTKKKLRLEQHSVFENQYGWSKSRSTIKDSKKTTSFVWNSKENKFVVSSRQVKKSIWYFKD